MSDKWIYSADLIREIKSVKPKESDWRKDNFEGYSLQEIRNRAALNVYNDILYIIEKAPSSNVAPVVRGHWIKDNDIDYGCSVCGRRQLWTNATVYEYCPHCGAKMDESEDKNDV